ncbi:MAG: EamA family transporter [bacterium]|nr:EamA family transporter [bacterium]
MPFWLIVVIAAHLLNAVAFLVDKYLLARAVPKPAVYAFYVGLLGSLGILALPFDWQLPSGGQWVLDGAAGATFVIALLCFFGALKRGEASRIVPYVGGTIPIWTFVLAYLFLGERLAAPALFAFIVLVAGSALITREGGRGGERKRHAYTMASLSAIAFAVTAVLMKAVFTEQSFLAGFAWTRVGATIAALAILLHAPSRRAIVQPAARPRGSTAGLFIAGQGAGALGFFALQYAISVASPTIINALQGVQYAFLFLFAVFFGGRFPQLRERLNRRIISGKIISMVLIAIGLALLAAGA